MWMESCKPMPASRKLIQLVVMVRATRQTALSKLRKVSAFLACPLLLLDVFEARTIRGNALHVLAVAHRTLAILAEPCWTMLNLCLSVFLQLISTWSQDEDLNQVTSLGIEIPSPSFSSKAIKLWTRKSMNWSTWKKTNRILKQSGWPPSVSCRTPPVQEGRGLFQFCSNKEKAIWIYWEHRCLHLSYVAMEWNSKILPKRLCLPTF